MFHEYSLQIVLVVVLVLVFEEKPIYTSVSPYSSRGVKDTSNTGDGIYRSGGDGAASTTSAWLYGLQQTTETRSNVALVNTGETDASTNVFSIDIYNGGAGVKVVTVEGISVGARRWLQINSIPALHAPGVSQGYAQVKRTSGNNPFIVMR